MGMRILLMLMAVPLLWGNGWAADIEGPEPAAPEVVAAFVAAHGGADRVDILRWVGADLKHDELSEGFDGTVRYCHEYVVLEKDAVTELSVVQVYKSPRVQLKKVEITVDGASGHRRWRKKDLRWVESTNSGGGVVTLDGIVATAFVPGIEVGDRVRVYEEYRRNGMQGLPPVRLGTSDIPYLESTYELRLPAKYGIRWRALGSQFSRDRIDFSEPEAGKKGHYRWSLGPDENGELPLCRERYAYLKLVPHVVNLGGNAKGDWSFGETWAEVGEEYLETIDGVFDVSEEMAAMAAELTDAAAGTDEKIDLLYAWVQQRCHYLGLYRGTDGIIPKSAIEVNRLGSGDCKGLATLLIGLLRSVGVEAHPVLVLTASGGALAEDIPNMVQFNHYIAWAQGDSSGIFLDGTVDRHPAGTIPLSDARSKVLLLKPGAVQMVAIPATAWERGTGQRTVLGRLDNTGHAHFELTYTVTDALARLWRNRLSDYSQQSAQEAMLHYLVPDEFACEAEAAELSGLDDWRAPVEMSVSLTTTRPLPKGGNAIYIPRNIVGDEMLADIDLPCGGRLDLRSLADRQVTWQLELPAGYAVTVSDSLAWQAPGLEWTRRCWQEGQTFHLERQISYTEDFLTTAEADSLSAVLKKIRAAEVGYFEVRQQ